MKTLKSPDAPVKESATKNTLAALVKRIEKHLSTEFASVIEVGIYLKTIRDEYLYETDGYESFSAFVKKVYTEEGLFSVTEATRRIEMAKRMLAIRSRNLPEPTSDRQMRPLRRFDPDVAANVWEKAVTKITSAGAAVTEKSVTAFLENGATEIEATVTQEEPARSWSRPETEEGEPDIDFSQEPEAETEPAQVNLRFSASALVTLERIDKFAKAGKFPPTAKEAIIDKTIFLSDDELQDWGRLDDEEFVMAGFLIFRRKWSFNKAYRFNVRALSSTSTLEDLVNSAIAHGSVLQPVFIEEFQIEIRPVKRLA